MLCSRELGGCALGFSPPGFALPTGRPLRPPTAPPFCRLRVAAVVRSRREVRVRLGFGEWRKVAQVVGTGPPPPVGASAPVGAGATPVKGRRSLVAGNTSGLAGVLTLATAAPGLGVGLLVGLGGASSRVAAAVAAPCAGA
jgi:hypothetical protein